MTLLARSRSVVTAERVLDPELDTKLAFLILTALSAVGVIRASQC
jgi:hypothetical protein